MKYKVIQCLKCSEIYVSSAVKNFSCSRCNRTTSYIRTKKAGCFYKVFDNPLDAKDYCIGLKYRYPRQARFAREAQRNQTIFKL